MPRSVADLRSDALAIWRAAVDAVRSDRLVKHNVCIDGDWLTIGDETGSGVFGGGQPSIIGSPIPPKTPDPLGLQLVADTLRVPLTSIRRIAVVGAGKAGAGMATGLLEALGPRVLAEKQVTGWI